MPIDLSRFKDTGDLLLPKPLKMFLETYLIGSPTSLFYITLWSVLHFLTGCSFALYFARTVYGRTFTYTQAFWTAFVIHTLWEIWQLVITNTPTTLRGYIDFLVDTGLFMAGFVLTAWFSSTMSKNQ